MREKTKRALLTLDISSTGVGYALLFCGKRKSGVLTAEHTSGHMRVLFLTNLFEEQVLGELLTNAHFVDVVVEQPFYVAKGSYDTPIKMAHGAFLKAIADHVYHDHFSWNDVHVSTWRNKICPGLKKGDDKKQAVIDTVTKYFRLRRKIGNDEADALGIMMWLFEHTDTVRKTYGSSVG